MELGVQTRGKRTIEAHPDFRLTEQQREAIRVMGGSQRHTLLVGGARSQKTFTIVRQILVRAMRGAYSRHAILRFRNNSVWPSIAMDTLPKVRRLCFPGLALQEHKQLGYFSLPNHAEIWLGGLDDGDRVEKILGNEYVSMYYNETSQIPYGSIVTANTRLAQKIEGLQQRAYYDLNPTGKGHFTYNLFYEHRDPISKQPLVDPENYVYHHMSPLGNRSNLSPEYIQALETMPERQRKRFLDGMYADENENALWTYEVIERNRRTMDQVPPLQQIIVVVDPSGAADDLDTGHDLIGIVVIGLGVDGHGYLLADLSQLSSPAIWGKAAVAAYHGGWAQAKGLPPEKYLADRIVAEVNYGGAMVKHTIQTVSDGIVPVRIVTASRGKHVRAEPVSAVYERNMFHHVGRFPELEDELCSFTNYGYMGAGSPNRADAVVWGATDLKLADTATAFLEQMRKEHDARADPARPKSDPSGGLIDLYLRTLNDQMPKPKQCARPECVLPLPDNGDKVTDGYNTWHRECYSPYAPVRIQ